MLDIRNLTRSKPPRLPYDEMAKTILPGWEISLVFVGRVRAQKLNALLRNKEYIPNVLSYESGTKSGEIIICPAVAKKEHMLYSMKASEYIGYLFIHGLLHLKGYPHGTTMDRLERAHTARFIGVSVPHGSTNNDRHRYRDTSNESRRRRGGTHTRRKAA